MVPLVLNTGVKLGFLSFFFYPISYHNSLKTEGRDSRAAAALATSRASAACPSEVTSTTRTVDKPIELRTYSRPCVIVHDCFLPIPLGTQQERFN
jgi:hypothetical protein